MTTDYPNKITFRSDDNVMEKETVITGGKGAEAKVTAIRYEYTKSATKLGKHLTLSIAEIATLKNTGQCQFEY
jgi:hypothetical protein